MVLTPTLSSLIPLTQKRRVGCSNRLAELLLRHSMPHAVKVDILIGFDIAYIHFSILKGFWRKAGTYWKP